MANDAMACLIWCGVPLLLLLLYFLVLKGAVTVVGRVFSGTYEKRKPHKQRARNAVT